MKTWRKIPKWKQNNPTASDMSSTITLRLPHPGQQEILQSPARFKVLACGRRWGKSELGLIDILRAAHLEHKRCWWVAPTYQMADQIWRDLVNAVKHLKDVVISRTQRRIDLPKGGVIAIRSAHNPDKLRGDGLDFVVLDEAARMPARIWHDVIRPMLAKTRGVARFLSTPKGRNWFWERHRDGDDPLQEEWQSFHYPTAQSQLVDPDELESIQQNTPAVLDAGNGKMVALERFNQVGWELQRDRLVNVVEKWRPQVVWAEANSIGEPNIDALVRQGLPIRRFYTSAKSKAPLIESLSLAIERNDITLLDDPVLLGELADYRFDRLSNGSYRYGAPAGSHDDTVIAAALAWHGAQHSTRDIIGFA